MERHYGGEGIALTECINERLGKWKVRWNVLPYTDEEGESHVVSFLEADFKKKPALEDIRFAALATGIYPTVGEMAQMGTELGADAEEACKKLLEDLSGQYDKSEAVNSFTLAGRQMWLDKETRVGLVNSINIEKAAGKISTTLWFDAVQYDIPIDTALQMLAALEMYALASYNVTQRHIAAIRALEGMQAVIGYDYTTGYPDKLVFN